MKIDRKQLLSTLAVASLGITKREILEQSHSIIFDDEFIFTFNDAIFTKGPNPLPDVEGAVPAEDLMAVLSKFPDEEVDISQEDGELRVSGKRRNAGISMSAEVHLPFSDVPGPGEWVELPVELMGNLIQAARICGKDEALPTTTVVHLTPQWVEACDNYRLFRSALETKMEDELLIPGLTLEALGDVVFRKFSVNGGWFHLQTKRGHEVSVRCQKGKYPDLTPLLELKDPKKIKFPGDLADAVDRAEVMQDFNGQVKITIASGKLTIRARKEGGWLEETKLIEYNDEPISFEVNSKFLHDVLKKTRKVTIAGNRLCIRSGETVFCVCLEMPEEKGEEKKKSKVKKTRKSDEEE